MPEYVNKYLEENQFRAFYWPFSNWSIISNFGPQCSLIISNQSSMSSDLLFGRGLLSSLSSEHLLQPPFLPLVMTAYSRLCRAGGGVPWPWTGMSMTTLESSSMEIDSSSERLASGRPASGRPGSGRPASGRPASGFAGSGIRCWCTNRFQPQIASLLIDQKSGFFAGLSICNRFFYVSQYYRHHLHHVAQPILLIYHHKNDDTLTWGNGFLARTPLWRVTGWLVTEAQRSKEHNETRSSFMTTDKSCYNDGILKSLRTDVRRRLVRSPPYIDLD